MSATTTGEIAYVSLTMIIGAVVNSWVLSEVINIVTFIDHTQVEVSKRKGLIRGFADHTELDEVMHRSLREWVDTQAQKGMLSNQYDRESMKEILAEIPQTLTQKLPNHVYNGRIQKSHFLRVCLSHARQLPPRLSLLLAVALNKREFLTGEVVYQLHDHPFNLFLVDSGVFAFVGKATPEGGVDEAPQLVGKEPNANGLVGPLAALRLWVPRGNSQTGAVIPSGSPSKKMGALGKSISSRMLDLTSPSGKGKQQKARTSTRDPAASGLNLGMQVVLTPYQLLCSGTYFGDVEILEPGPRRATMRCESNPSGSLLLLHKQDLFRLCEDFPMFGNAWRAAAHRRELARRFALARHTIGRSYSNFAAFLIQTFVRLRRAAIKEQSGRSPVERFQEMRLPEKPRMTSAPSIGIDHAGMGLQAEEDSQEHLGGHSKVQGSVVGHGTSGFEELKMLLQHELRTGLADLRSEMRSGLEEIRQASGRGRAGRFNRMQTTPAQDPSFLATTSAAASDERVGNEGSRHRYSEPWSRMESVAEEPSRETWPPAPALIADDGEGEPIDAAVDGLLREAGQAPTSHPFVPVVQQSPSS
eukprot:gnl/TRDRNA2_/TRDRNA2_82916_c0_seq1.p1 gnl/TRDRNA2_/TRDRNA2_82916_c0~~gnl/TRDRNA2_/TRDRNA2_82916_c0_seq1.p1  ORF type:complete len:679 (+),score=119.73 gnl/TRDRNA2_/TRDRNA2_82916_c0_seq1:281-2038(+)